MDAKDAIIITLVAVVGMAAIWDIFTHKIPNYISLFGWIAAPIIYTLAYGVDGLIHSGLGLILVLALTFPLYALRMMGAGDVKLMTTVGAFVGVDRALYALLFIFIAGALFSLGYYAYRGGLKRAVYRVKAMFGMSLAMRKAVYIPPDEETSTIRIPYAVAIAIGTFSLLLYRHGEIAVL